jgi:hypothetical protein
MQQTSQTTEKAKREDEKTNWDSEFKSSAFLVFEIYYCRFPKRSYLIFRTRENIRTRTVAAGGLGETDSGPTLLLETPLEAFCTTCLSAAPVLGVKTRCAMDLRDQLVTAG